MGFTAVQIPYARYGGVAVGLRFCLRRSGTGRSGGMYCTAARLDDAPRTRPKTEILITARRATVRATKTAHNPILLIPSRMCCEMMSQWYNASWYNASCSIMSNQRGRAWYQTKHLPRSGAHYGYSIRCGVLIRIVELHTIAVLSTASALAFVHCGRLVAVASAGLMSRMPLL